MMGNKEIIESSINEVFNDFMYDKEGFKILIDFMNFINKVNLNTIFTDSGKDAIINYIIDDSNRQDTLIDMINSLSTRLLVNGLDTSELIHNIMTMVNKVNTSNEIPKELSKQLKIDVKGSPWLLGHAYLLKLYGVSIIYKLAAKGYNRG